jgi:RNA polymerase sigma-70 factor, ECF subfamily
MSDTGRQEVRTGLEPCLARLWRYALVLSGASEVAEALVQATCARAIERAGEFAPGTRLDRWLFAILRSIWLNKIRPRRVREDRGFVRDGDALSTGRAHLFGTNEVLKAIGGLPEAHRETAFLVYGEGYSYEEAARLLEIPIDTLMSRLAIARSALAKPK